MIEINQRTELDKLFLAIDSCISEFSFSNTFIFQHGYKQSIDRMGDNIIIASTDNDNNTYALLTNDLTHFSLDEIETILKKYKFIYPVDEKWLTHLGDDPRFATEALEEDFDYLYLAEKLTTMPGRKLSKRRNLAKQYHNLYTLERKPMERSIQIDALTVLDNWANNRLDGGREGYSDYDQAKVGIMQQEELGLEGYVFYSNGEPSGFCLGSTISNKTFNLLFQKGDVRYKGVYQAMNMSFAETIVGTHKYINFQQDLGDPGLRQSKSAYYPDIVLKKYSIFLK